MAQPLARDYTTKRQQTVHPAHLSVVDAARTDAKPEFDRLFQRFAPYVAAIALRLLGDELDVDDMVQDVFWDFSRTLHKISDMEHARRWLVQVTVRKTRRLLRRRRLALFIHLPLSQTIDPPMPTATADDRAAVIQLFTLLEQLPVNHRLAWSLRFLTGAELVEVADACGCSLATAKRWIRSAQTLITGDAHV